VHSANHFKMEDGEIVPKQTEGDTQEDDHAPNAALDFAQQQALTTPNDFETEYDTLAGIANRANLAPIAEPPVAIMFQKFGGVDKALQYLQQVTVDDPGNVDHHNDLGNAWRVKGRTTLAVQCFRKCLHIDPRNTVALLNLAVVMINTGYPEDAESLLRTALDIEPLSVLHHFTLGNTLVARGMHRLAAKSFRRALSLQPDFILAQTGLMKLISSGWLNDVDKGSSTVLENQFALEHVRDGSERPIPYVVKSPQRMDIRGGLVQVPLSWVQTLESKVATHWVSIVTSIALVLTVMGFIYPDHEGVILTGGSNYTNGQRGKRRGGRR